jgi:glutaredoxin 2
LIDTAREKLATDRKAVDALGRELEYERQLLRGKGQPAIDEFNRKVDRYNALLAEARKSQSSVNELVESYNAKLQRYSR